MTEEQRDALESLDDAIASVQAEMSDTPAPTPQRRAELEADLVGLDQGRKRLEGK